MLHHLHHNVHILERSVASVPENQGAGLAVGTDLQRYMSVYDVTSLPYSVESPYAQRIDTNGTVVNQIGIQQMLSSWECLYYRLRANFDGLASDYVPHPPEKDSKSRGSVRYEYGKTVEILQEDGEGKVRVEYTDPKGRTETLVVDLVIAADGASSTVRQMFEPTAERKYTGCVGWRGTILESDISQKTKDHFGDIATFCQIERSYIISYVSPSQHCFFTSSIFYGRSWLCSLVLNFYRPSNRYAIPGRAGEVEQGHRLRNWVWYSMHPFDSPSYKEVMTANDGHQHRVTVPIGKVPEELWRRQKTRAVDVLDPFSAELVSKTTEPFIQALTDVIAPQATFLAGKVFLVGDALATFRPMTGQSTNQAARNAMDMREWLEGRMTLEEWERGSLQYARETRQLGVERARGFGIE